MNDIFELEDYEIVFFTFSIFFMKRRQLESELSSIPAFKSPKVELEQYPTTAHLASQMIYTADTVYGDILDASICDLGVGCGILTCATIMMGSVHNIGIDIDMDALIQAKDNLAEFEMNKNVDLILADISSLLESSGTCMKVDTVVMNPPFGTRVAGIDMKFLQFATLIAQKSIYSLHKTSTRAHVIKVSESFGWKAEVVAEMKYDIKSSYKFHKKKSVDIEVDFIRFTPRT